MLFESIQNTDLDQLKVFEPPNWGDLVPRFRYHIDSRFCNPVKLTNAGKMVAIGTVIFHKDSAWLASIIVHPDERNQGLGNKITTYLINSIDREKYTTIYLDATDMGFPVYQKIGFELETSYAHLKSEENISGLRLSDRIIPYHEKYLAEILQLDMNISCENRKESITENILTSKLFVRSGIVEAVYFPTFGNGLIIADNDQAGIELVKYRLENNYYAILPTDNIATIEFLKQCGLKQFRISRRMYIGKKRPWKADRIYNRISGQLG